MSTPVLATKLQLPVLRPELVARPRLVTILDTALDTAARSRLTLVCAPAGFGKTTLLGSRTGAPGSPGCRSTPATTTRPGSSPTCSPRCGRPGAWFAGSTVVRENDGTTTLRDQVADQAARHGLLGRIRDLGVTLLSVRAVDHPRLR